MSDYISCRLPCPRRLFINSLATPDAHSILQSGGKPSPDATTVATKVDTLCQVDRKKINQAMKALGIWAWKDLIKPRLSVIVVAVLPTLTLWIGKGKTFFGSSHLLPGWAVSALLTGALLGLSWASRSLLLLRRRSKWYSWNGVDWQFLPMFFDKGPRLEPETAPDLAQYVKGPFCQNLDCRRELNILDITTPNGFAHAMARCQCDNRAVTFDFRRMILGMTPLRAILTEAVREAQAAARRGERFRNRQ